jgi:hypothetical protein
MVFAYAKHTEKFYLRKVMQGRDWHTPSPWLLGLPLLVSVLPAIILSGIPDDEADRIAGKQTLVVKLGRVCAVQLAMVDTVLAAGMAVMWMLTQYLRASVPPGRSNGLMLASLSYILWFGLIALVGLASQSAVWPLPLWLT